MPLQESAVTAEVATLLKNAALIIGESRKETLARAKRDQAHCFFLDNMNQKDQELLLGELSRVKGDVALFSDSGMAGHCDPGGLVIRKCVEFGFTIRTLPGPTSSGIALALSGWEPPVLIFGFLPRDDKERARAWNDISKEKHPVLILETPYRFQKLVSEASHLKGKWEIFVAWEIGSLEEGYLWCTQTELQKKSAERNWTKGEFILMLRKPK